MPVINEDNEQYVDFVNSLKFINPATYATEQEAIALQRILNSKASDLELDSVLVNMAYGEKRNTEAFYDKTMDQFPHYSPDYFRLKKFIIDWYAAHKTLASKARGLTDVNSMTTEEINELILSMGFPYPRNIRTRSSKIQFLLAIIDLYKRKGTAYSIWKVLQFFGLSNISISEWWLKFDPTIETKLYLESNPVYPPTVRADPNYVTTKPFSAIPADPYWQQSATDITSAYFDASNKISLPSITPYLSVDSQTSLTDLELAIAILQRKMFETLNFWIGNDLILQTKTAISDTTTGTSIQTLIGNIKILDEPDNELTSPVIVGPNAIIGTAFENQQRKIAFYDSDTETWSFAVSDPTIGYIVDSSSLYLPNSLMRIAVVNGELKIRSWDSFSIKHAFISEVYNLTAPNVIDSSNPFSVVFNGEEWVSLFDKIPESLVTNTINSYESTVYRPIILNDFSNSYSTYEVMLAITYLTNGFFLPTQEEVYPGATGNDNSGAVSYLVNFDDIDIDNSEGLSWAEIVAKYPTAIYNDTVKFNTTIGDGITRDELKQSSLFDRHVFYSGAFSKYYVPFDRNNDNVDDFPSQDPYASIINNYNNLVFDKDLLQDVNPSNLNLLNPKTTSFRHVSRKYPYKRDGGIDPRRIRTQKLKQYYDDYTKISEIGPTHELLCQQHAENYLKAINPQFFKDLVEKSALEPDIFLENLMRDFEDYVSNEMGIPNFNATFVQLGGVFLRKKLKKVLDFFKPYRARFLDFITAFGINNPLMDSMIPGDGDRMGAAIDQLFIDKPFPNDMQTDFICRHGLFRSLKLYPIKPGLDLNINEIPEGVATVSFDNNTQEFVVELVLNFYPKSVLLGISPNIYAMDVLVSSNITELNKTVEVRFPHSLFEDNQTLDNHLGIMVTTAPTSVFNSATTNGLWGDIGFEMASICSRQWVLDNGLPMDDRMIAETELMVSDTFANPFDETEQGKIIKSPTNWEIYNTFSMTSAADNIYFLTPTGDETGSAAITYDFDTSEFVITYTTTLNDIDNQVFAFGTPPEGLTTLTYDGSDGPGSGTHIFRLSLADYQIFLNSGDQYLYFSVSSECPGTETVRNHIEDQMYSVYTHVVTGEAYTGLADKNNLDMRMNDNFYVNINTIDPADSSAFIYEVEINMDDGEIVGDSLAIYMDGLVDGKTYTAEQDPVTNGCGILSWDSSTQEFVVNFITNMVYSGSDVIFYESNNGTNVLGNAFVVDGAFSVPGPTECRLPIADYITFLNSGYDNLYLGAVSINSEIMKVDLTNHMETLVDMLDISIE